MTLYGVTYAELREAGIYVLASSTVASARTGQKAPGPPPLRPPDRHHRDQQHQRVLHQHDELITVIPPHQLQGDRHKLYSHTRNRSTDQEA